MKASIALAAVVLLFTGVLVKEAVHDLRVTDEQIEAGSPEDTLGFGIWPFLAIFGVPPLIALAWLWKRAATARQRRLAVVVTLAFAVAILFNMSAYEMLRARVFK